MDFEDSASSKPCPTCGERAFSIVHGVKSCNLCGTEDVGHLTLETQEFDLRDFSRILQVSKKGRGKAPSSKDKDINNWTSYEAFNITLFEWTQALRACGASKEFQDIVFKLWVVYLQKMEVAFLEEEEQDERFKPKASLFEKNRDIQLIHNEQDSVTITKKKRKTRKKTELEKLESRLMTKRMKYGENTSVSISLTDMMNSSLKEMEKSQNVQPDETERESTPVTRAQPICHSAVANRVLGIMKTGDEEEQEAESRGKEKNKYIQMKMPFNINYIKLLSLLYLGVLLAEEDILLMDILRWCREGQIPFLSAANLLRQDMTILHKDQYMFMGIRNIPKAEVIQDNGGKFALFVSMQYIPVPSEDGILERLVDIFQLPALTCKLAKEVIKRMPDNALFRTKVAIPDIEGIAMGAILHILKFCCGLDDVQEVNLSRAAEKIGRHLIGSSKQLFSWAAWERYMMTLLWFCSKVDVMFATQCYKYDLTDFTISKNICDYHWEEGIWRKAKSASGYGQTATDYKIIQKLLDYQGNPLEDRLDQQTTLKLSKNPLMDIVDHFLERSRDSTDKDTKELVKVAKSLKKTTFTSHFLNWPAHLDDVQAELEKCGSDLVLRPQSISTNIINTYPDGEETLIIPQPHKHVMKLKVRNEEIKNLPKSFNWMASLGSMITETDKEIVVKHCNLLHRRRN